MSEAELEARVATHYGGGGITELILADLEVNGFDPATRPAARPFESFHIGGAEAVEHLLDAMPDLDGAAVLDIGCGVGGTSRALARRGAIATGVDLTPEFVETARALSGLVGSQGIAFEVGSALDLPFAAGSFDHAVMIHVGMNIADKPKAMAEAARVLRPGGTFAIYDIMRIAPGELTYPLPWALDEATSFPAAPRDYLAAARAAGFAEIARATRADYGIAALGAQIENDPTGTILVGPRVGRVRNLLDEMRAGRLAPVEMVLRLTM